ALDAAPFDTAPFAAAAPVLGAVLARLVLLPVGDGWGVFDVEAGEVDVAPLPSLDPTRRVGSVQVRRDPGRVLRGASRDRGRVRRARSPTPPRPACPPRSPRGSRSTGSSGARRTPSSCTVASGSRGSTTPTST